MLFRLPPQDGSQATGMDVDELRKQVEAILPEAQVTDFREANPALVNGLDRATAMLTLVCLVTMVLSAIGVAMAMHAHLQQRLETIAIMKALGARSSQVMRIYLLQTLFLGVVGALLGVGAGFGVARAFPYLLERLISLPVEGQLAFSPVLIGLFTGILTTLLFTLPPLLEIRNFRPLRILRRNVEQEQGTGLRHMFPRDPVQIVAIGDHPGWIGGDCQHSDAVEGGWRMVCWRLAGRPHRFAAGGFRFAGNGDDGPCSSSAGD